VRFHFMFCLCVLTLTFPLASRVSAKNPETGFLDRTLSLHGQTYKYQVFLPENWTPKQKWPIILFLHGFGERGSEGKVAAVQFARVQRIPYFGICFGMQMAVIEGARHLADIPRAGSTEFGPSPDPVIGLMTEWTRGNAVERRNAETELGGTMRLGAYPCDLGEGTRVRQIYGAPTISERHRHRYEVNITYKSRLEQAGFVFSGMSPDGELPEIVELPNHPWFVGVQFHPELKSKPFEPHPLFTSFVKAALDQSRLV